MNLKDKILEQQDILENYKYFLDKLELKDNDKTFELYLKELMILFLEKMFVDYKVLKFNYFSLKDYKDAGLPNVYTIVKLKNSKNNDKIIKERSLRVLTLKGISSSEMKLLMSYLKEKLK